MCFFVLRGRERTIRPSWSTSHSIPLPVRGYHSAVLVPIALGSAAAEPALELLAPPGHVAHTRAQQRDPPPSSFAGKRGFSLSESVVGSSPEGGCGSASIARRVVFLLDLKKSFLFIISCHHSSPLTLGVSCLFCGGLLIL